MLVNISQKGYLEIVLIGLITLIFLGLIFFFVNNLKPVPSVQTSSAQNPVSSANGLIVPNKLFYSLVTYTAEKERLAVFKLTYEEFGETCGLLSQLSVKDGYKDNILTIDVLGYYLVENGKNPCISGIITRAEAKIKIDTTWLEDTAVKKLIVSLNGQSNEYILQRDGYKVSLIPVKESNLDPYTYGGGSEVTLFPLGIRQLVVLGEVDYQKDYREELRRFARTKNLIPADEVYPGLEQDNTTRVYVKAKYFVGLNEGITTNLGSLPSDKKIEVHISKLVDLGN